MKDKTKEINIPENVLVALSDLTNGALNYYIATETVKARHNTIFDYITNLQKSQETLIKNDNETIINLQEENKELLDKVRDRDKLIVENIQLKRDRIDKAIKILKEAGCYDEETKTFCDDIYDELPDILNTLEGSDKSE